MKITEQQIEEFVEMAHKVGRYGLTACSSGNLSWRIGDEVLVSGTGSWVPEIRKEQVSVVRFSDGEVLNGVKPSMESVFHLGVLRERPDQTVVLHFQASYATAISCMKVRPKSINVTAEVPYHVGVEIPEIPYYRPGSPELADAVIAALKEHNSAFMLKHGQVVCGKDFNQALERATFMEMASRLAVLNGDNLETFTDAEVEEVEVKFLGKKK